MKKIGYNLMYKSFVWNIFRNIFKNIVESLIISTQDLIGSCVTLGTACPSPLRQELNNIELESRADRQEMIY